MSAQQDILAAMANDLFNKRQRLINASQRGIQVVDDQTANAMEAEYRSAEAEYRAAKAAFARAMKTRQQSN